MTLSSPHGVVVGASDVTATVAFLERFGFEPRGRTELDERSADALFGLPDRTPLVSLGVPGADAGTIDVVETSVPAVSHGPFDRGAHALDLYTRDMDASIEVARAAGARIGPVGAYPLRDLTVREAATTGPDGLRLVLIELPERRPSVLDDDPDRLHSEVHSIVWAVDDLDAALVPWVDAGLAPLVDVTLQHPAISTFMELPREDVPVRLALLADGEAGPARLELLTFPDDRGPGHAALPLAAGGFVPVVVADDPAAVGDRLGASGLLADLPGGGTAVVAEVAGGVTALVRTPVG